MQAFQVGDVAGRQQYLQSLSPEQQQAYQFLQQNQPKPLAGPPMGNPGFQGGTMSPDQMRQLPQFQALEAQQNALAQQQQQLLQGMPEYNQLMQLQQQMAGLSSNQVPSQEQIAAIRQLQQQIEQNPQMQALQQQGMQLSQQYQQLAQPYQQAFQGGMGQMAKAMPFLPAQQPGGALRNIDTLPADFSLPPATQQLLEKLYQSSPMMTPEQVANMPGPSLAHVGQPTPDQMAQFQTLQNMMQGMPAQRAPTNPLGQTAAQGIGSLLGNFAQSQKASAQPPTQMQQTPQAAPQPAGAGGFGQQNPQQPNYTASGGGGGGGMGGF
jgi:hypothetical protein